MATQYDNKGDLVSLTPHHNIVHPKGCVVVIAQVDCDMRWAMSAITIDDVIEVVWIDMWNIHT